MELRQLQEENEKMTKVNERLFVENDVAEKEKMMQQFNKV
jgi:hypothetical protein